MTIRDEARAAQRRMPDAFWRVMAGEQCFEEGFRQGAVWASEQAEVIDRMGPAAGCAYCVGAGGYEDYDGEWRECSCQRADREPSDAEVEAAASAMYRMTNELSVSGARDLARAALIAAQEVRR